MKRYLVAIVLSALCVVIFTAYKKNAVGEEKSKISKPPLALAFSLDKGAEVIEIEIRIVEKQIYTFGLGFMYDTNVAHDSDRVLALINDTRNPVTHKYTNLGVPLTVRLRVQSLDADIPTVVFEKVESEIERYAGGFGSYEKKIANINLEPGHYKVRIENILAAPALQGTSTNFHIRRAYLGK